MDKRRIVIFLVVGTSTVVVDSAVYALLITQLVPSLAKALSFVSGTIFAYFANRFWTFGDIESAMGSVSRFALLYATSLFVNVAINGLVLNLLVVSIDNALIFAFFVATGCSAALNYLGLKRFVFRPIDVINLE